MKLAFTFTGMLTASLLLQLAAFAQQDERMPVRAQLPATTTIMVPGKTISTPNNHARTEVSKSSNLSSINRNAAPLFSASDILVNNNDNATGTEGFTQSETSVLAFGNNVVVGFNDAGSAAGSANKFTGFAYSTDGGATFTDGGTLPNDPVGDAGDPVMARNEATGRIYFATLGFNSPFTIQVFRSDNNGVTWMAPVNGTPGGNDEDKEWLAVDNFPGTGNGNVYLLSRRFGAAPLGIYFFRSTDNGNSFGPTGGTLIVSGNQGAFVAVAPDHSIYAFWRSGSAIQMRKSTDQGSTFGPAITVASGLTGGINGDLGLTGIVQGTTTAQGFRSNEFPHAAINPVNGNVYVTYDNHGAGSDRADVFFVTSTDGGNTWSAPAKVNDDATTTDQWQPTVAVTPDGQHLGIFYYSRQEDATNNNLFKYYGRVAAVAGATVTFAPSFAVSSVASLPEFGRDAFVNSTYMGDYNTAAASNSLFYVVWNDNRDDLAGGAPRKDPNVYFKTVSVTGVDNEPPVITCPANITSGNSTGQCSANITITPATATDNSGTVTVHGVRSDGLNLTDPYPVGTTTITWTATDPSNNTASCSQTVTVNDTESPTVITKNITIVLDATGHASITPAQINNGSHDNCTPQANLVFALNKSTFSCADLGANTVVLSVTDANGNTGTGNAIVTVVDNTPPVISGLSVTPQSLWPPNNKMRDVTVAYTVTDNCSVASTTLSVSSNEPVGSAPDWIILDNHHVQLRAQRLGSGTGRVYIIIVRATDTYGNSTTQSITVNVPHDQGQSAAIVGLNAQNNADQNVNGLALHAYPNPSSAYFTLVTRSNSDRPVALRTIDAMGRTVEARGNILANGTIQIGQHYRPGIYFVEAVQGNSKVTLKVVKLSN